MTVNSRHWVHILVFFHLLLSIGAVGREYFDVRAFGAVADGKTDNSKAFVRAWNVACRHNGKSAVWIPVGIYKLEPVAFIGPCRATVAFVLKGTLKAPTHFSTNTWIGFRYLDQLLITGGGFLDGQGAQAWTCKDNDNDHKKCGPRPVTLRLDFVTNSSIRRIHSVNSQNVHINVFACQNMSITDVTLTAPSDSPNTDGIHIGCSSKITISHSIIGTGDDCIAMVAGSQQINISHVTCGPGHGISIGSLGRGFEDQIVDRITVTDCTFIDTDNGVRIKTWAPSSYTVASNIAFRNLVMNNVRNPILIDQKYCPSRQCPPANSGVQLVNVTYQNITGVSSSKVAVNLQCSKMRPCKNIKLIDINMWYLGRPGLAKAECSNVLGSSYGKQNPGGCL